MWKGSEKTFPPFGALFYKCRKQYSKKNFPPFFKKYLEKINTSKNFHERKIFHNI